MRWIQQTETITSSTEWTAPTCRDQKFEVTLWGAGGSGSTDGAMGDKAGGGGGGAGEMKFKELTIEAGERVNIQIGQGGEGVVGATTILDYCDHMVGRSGGPTVFGKYFMANGGLGGNGSLGGDGANDGGDAGETGEGDYLGFGVSKVVNGITVTSGGGASAINARGIGGSADRCQGNGGTGAGGAGCFVEVGPGNTVTRRIGAGGDGVCVIKYHIEVGDTVEEDFGE